MKTKDLTPDQHVALGAFVAKHGRYWKSKLLAMWETGTDADQPNGCYLRQIRSQFGPEWLNRQRSYGMDKRS